MHDWTRDSECIGFPVAFGLNEIYICVSSAYIEVNVEAVLSYYVC